MVGSDVIRLPQLHDRSVPRFTKICQLVLKLLGYGVETGTLIKFISRLVNYFLTAKLGNFEIPQKIFVCSCLTSSIIKHFTSAEDEHIFGLTTRRKTCPVTKTLTS